MALIYERIQTQGIAELSYFIGDDSTGIAAVIDPRPDVDVYLQLAREHGVSITHALETHIHADFVSGSHELAAQTGTAKIYASIEGGAEYGFEVQPVRNGQTFELGSIVLTARHTPGHTPEHMSYETAESGMAEPYAVFTGDSLFVNSAGRPDLLGKDADVLASQLYDTLYGYFANLADGVIIYPSHGSGSPCGADIGERLESTIGYEKRHNPFYQKKEREEFVTYALDSAPPEPTYYKRMKKVNAKGPRKLGHLPVIPALDAGTFKRVLEREEAVLVDTRDMLAFGGGHIPGGLNIGATPMLSIWAGWMLDPDKPILLVLPSDTRVPEVAQYFVRTGYTNFAGYLAGGMKAWEAGGHPLKEIPQMTVDEVHAALADLQIVDVRSPDEWSKGHVPTAKHIFLPDLPERLTELDHSRPVVTYCASGYRASIGASLLQQAGFQDIRTIPGSWGAWKRAGLPTTEEGDK